MRCERIPFKNGFAILCGRRGPRLTSKEKQMIADQTAFLEKCRKASDRCLEMAAEADKLHLPILAREWDHIGKCLEGAIGNQVRAFRDDTLATEERLGIQGESKS